MSEKEDFVDESLVEEQMEAQGEPLAAPQRDGAEEPRLSPVRKSGKSLRILFLGILLFAAGGAAFYYYTEVMSVQPVVSLANETAKTASDPLPVSSAAIKPVIPNPEQSAIMASADIPVQSLPPMPIPEPISTAVALTPAPLASVPDPLLVDTAVPPLPAAPAATAATLPVSPQTDILDLPAPVDLPVAEKMGTATNTPPAPSAIKANSPSAAELAIVQNDAILQGMNLSPSAPVNPAQNPLGAAAELPVVPGAAAVLPLTPESFEARQAVVRPVPEDYVVVKKEHDADGIDARLANARSALAQNRNSAAYELFNELSESYPKDRRILTGRAVALQKMGQTDAALAAYEEALTQDPRNVDALNNMLGLLKKQDPALALQKLIELREAYPYSADITAQLAVAYGANADYPQALKYLDMADTLTPGSVYVLYNRAVLYDKMGRVDQASDLYRQIVRMAAEGSIEQNLPIDSIKRRLAVLR
jgi:Flp pilus assembly protein TadD